MPPSSLLFFQTLQANPLHTPTQNNGIFTVCHASYSYTVNTQTTTTADSRQSFIRFDWQMLTQPQTSTPEIVHNTCNHIFLGQTNYDSLYSALSIRNKLHLAIDLVNEATRPDAFPSTSLRDRFSEALVGLYPLLNPIQRRRIMTIIQSKLGDLTNPFHANIESLNSRLEALNPRRPITTARLRR